MEYNRRIEELQCLSDIDESADYETDMSAICTDGTKFYFVSASGCSCWDGEFEESVYDSFEDLKKALITNDVSNYNPSLSGVKYLIETAESKLDYPKTAKLESQDLSLIDWLSSNSG